MAKIAIDAGHGGKDPGAVFEGRQEKDDNLRLALAVGQILEENGADVFYTRTEDIYQTPLEKAQAANEAGADWLISIHRNSGAIPDQYTGVETLVYNDGGEKAQLAREINTALAKVGFRNIGVSERPGLVVLRRSKMPAVLVEAGFINSEEDNLLFDEEFDRIAQGIAQSILSMTGAGMEKTDEEKRKPPVKPNCPPCPEIPPEKPVYYRVQTGAFRNAGNARRQLERLKSEGYPAFMIESVGYFMVQVGAFQNLGNATRMEGILRSRGYQTYITT